MAFEHDALVAHIRHVNPRTERHGEDEILACDVSARLLVSDNAGKVWDQVVLNACMDDQDAALHLAGIADYVAGIPFLATWSGCKVNFWISNTKLAALGFAKINKVKWARDEGIDHIDLRIQAQADGETMGALAELIGRRVRIEVVQPQAELDLAAEGVD